jgi:GMP synthase (glutamine-hydrolysing)
MKSGTAVTEHARTPFAMVIQHVAPEHAGGIGAALQRRGVGTRPVRIDEGQPVPSDLGGASALIVLGGPMGVYEADRYGHLRAEMRLIELALASELPILGICLGSQLLGSVLGATVRPGRAKEIGWHQVQLTSAASHDRVFGDAPRTFEAFHWHGDVFDLPPGSVRLASSESTPIQAFNYQSAYGLLFHLEVTATMVRDMVAAFADELTATGGSARGILHDLDTKAQRLGAVGTQIFDRFARLVSAP